MGTAHRELETNQRDMMESGRKTFGDNIHANVAGTTLLPERK
jgi:hypothetical protein